MQFTHDLDARGWICPLPVLRAQKLLRDMKTGDTLKVRMTDQNACRDFDLFARDGGVLLVHKELADGIWTIFLKKI